MVISGGLLRCFPNMGAEVTIRIYGTYRDRHLGFWEVVRLLLPGSPAAYLFTERPSG